MKIHNIKCKKKNYFINIVLIKYGRIKYKFIRIYEFINASK